MMKIGSHVSIKNGLLGAAKEAHSYDSGYDIINNFDCVMEEFDSIIGLKRLKVFHINGSLNPRGKDYIGPEALKYIVQHHVAKHLPIILETPWLDAKTNLYKEEIAFLRGEG